MTTPNQTLLEEIRTLEEKIIGSRKHANGILRLLELCGGGQVVSLAALQSLRFIFLSALDRGELQHLSRQQPESAATASGIFEAWLWDCYERFKAVLLLQIRNSEVSQHQLALDAMMLLIAKETEDIAENAVADHVENSILFSLMEQLVCGPDMDVNLVLHLKTKYVKKYSDLCYCMLRCLKKLMSEMKLDSSRTSEKSSKHAITLLLMLKPMSGGGGEEVLFHQQGTKRKREEEGDSQPKWRQMRQRKKLYGDCWILVLEQPLSGALYRKVLEKMEESILPHVQQPQKLADFLIDSYNVGGLVSLLALNGLFCLMSQHNLDYPQFYPKLYQLFTAETFTSQHRDRFVVLSELFLFSTHLPSYVPAAFAKRMAQISLTASPSTCLVLLAFVYNLILRHSALRPLIHCAKERAEGGAMYQPDAPLDRCNALSTSLWEVAALTQHYHPAVNRLAQQFSKPIDRLKTTKFELADFADQTSQSLFQTEMRHRQQSIPLTFSCKTALFDSSDNSFSGWQI